MNRPSRLKAAVSWLDKYDGKNLLRGYCKHFAVNWRSAAIELKHLGVVLDPNYLQLCAEAEKQLVAARRKRKEDKARADAEARLDWPPYDSKFEAYLAGDFAAVHAFETSEEEKH